MDRPEVRARILESLADPTRGSMDLQCAINLARAKRPGDTVIPKPVDFSGAHGAEVFALALAHGNWRAAALIIKGGYQPEQPTADVQYLLDHLPDAVDFFGAPALNRISIICSGHSSADECDLGLLQFILAVGGPWQERALTPRLFLLFLHGRGKALQQLLVDAGADPQRSLADVRAQLLEELGLAGMSTEDVPPIEQVARAADLKSVGMDECLIGLLVSPAADVVRDRRV